MFGVFCGGVAFVLFFNLPCLLCPSFYPEVGVLLFEQQYHLPHLFLCNAKEQRGEKAALLGNMLNKPKQYLKQLTLTLTRWEFHAYRVNGEAASNREKSWKNIANRAINTQVWKEWIEGSLYNSAVLLNYSGMKCSISMPSTEGRIGWCIIP